MDSTSKNIYQGDGTKINTPLENTTENIVPIVYDKSANILKTKDEQGNIIDINPSSVSVGGYPEGSTIYRALLQDNGTNTPDITIIQNTLGVVPSITKVQTGLWEVVHNLNEIDPYTKLDIQISNNVDGVNAVICVDTGSYNPIQFEFFTRDFITGNLIDTVLRATPIQIVRLP